MGPQADGYSIDDDLNDAADGVAGFLGGIDGVDHLKFRFRVGASDRRGLDLLPVDVAVHLGANAADYQGVAANLHAKFLQQPTGHGSRRHPRRRLPCAGTLQHIPDVVVAVLHGAGEVGVAGADAGDPVNCFLHGIHAHNRGPVDPILVFDGHGDGAAEGAPVADAGNHVGPILLNLHPTAPAVAPLTARHLRPDVVLAYGKAGRHSFDDDHQALPVGFSGGKKSNHSFLLILPYCFDNAVRAAWNMAATGAGRPVQVSNPTAPW